MNDLRTRIAWAAYFTLVTGALVVCAVLVVVGGGDL
jgi:hypothetical protein